MSEAHSPPAPSRLLRRSRRDRVLAGVCGGLGAYLGVDPILLRIAFVILAVAGGSGLLLYIAFWIVMPTERPGEVVPVPRSAHASGRVLAGAALISLGTILLVGRFVSWFDKVIGPIVLIGVGVAVLVWGARR